MSLVIIPGSFDPMTLGHLDLVRYAVQHYDRVVVAVMVNPEKRYLFDMESRAEIAERTVAEFPNVSVVTDTGMLIDLYDRLGADAVLKGWRNETDYQYEERMAEWNREHNPRFCTELIRATDDHGELSSTAVRAILERGELPSGLIHPSAMSLVMEKTNR